VLRHVVLLTWAPGTPPEAVEAVEAALSALPARIPEIRAYSFGQDAGEVAQRAVPAVDLAAERAGPERPGAKRQERGSGNADFAIVADFDDVDAWRVYQDDPEHQRVIAELIRPHLAVRSAAQFHV
jgi:hypothetical protein